MAVAIAQEVLDEGLVRDLADLLRACVDAGASIGFMAELTVQEARDFWAGVAREQSAGGVVALVARLDGRPAGVVLLRLAGMPNQPHRADVAKLMVAPAARRRGVARELMVALEAAAASRDRTLLVLDTARGDAAEPLYHSMGWRRLGEIPNYALYPDGRPCDTVVFWKSLPGAPQASAFQAA